MATDLWPITRLFLVIGWTAGLGLVMARLLRKGG